MLKKNQELCAHHSIRMNKNIPKPARKQETGKRIGMSYDFPLNTTKVTKFHPSSVSIFTNQRAPATNMGAGLSTRNSRHAFMYSNGDETKAKMFANFVKHGVKFDKEQRKKIEYMMNDKALLNRVEKIKNNKKTARSAAVRSPTIVAEE